jgi:hypothetical protein
MFDFLGELGYARKDRVEMFAAALRPGERPKPSRDTMRRFHALSDMLREWRGNKKYTAADGAPRVLLIRGKGATLETLARKFLPKVPINEVVDAICTGGEVQRRKDDKVALLGSNVIMHEKTTEKIVAAFIAQVRALASSCLHNIKQPIKGGSSYFDCVVTGVLSDKKFQEFAQSIRPQLGDVCEYVEAGLEIPAKPEASKKGKPCGVVVFIYREDGPLYSIKKSLQGVSLPRAAHSARRSH